MISYVPVMILFLMLSTVTIISSSASVHDTPVSVTRIKWKTCGQGYCVCGLHTAQCISKKRRLHFIPKLNDNITHILFENNLLPNVTAETMSNVSCLELIRLSLVDNQIESISVNAFTLLKHIKLLDLSKNPGLKSLSNAFNSLEYSQITRLILNDLNLKTLKDGDFTALENTQLKIISLAGNKLKTVDFRVFVGLKYFTNMELDQNEINSLKLQRMSNLTELSVSDNNLQYTPKFCDNVNNSLLPNLRVLILNRNHLYKLDDKSFSCLPQIRSLSVEGNTLRNLGNNILSSMPLLETFNMSSTTSGFKFIVEDFAFNSSSLTNLITEFNHLSMWTFNEDHLFNKCKNLKLLDLDGGTLPRNIERTFAPLKKLQQLHLMFTGQYKIPENLNGILPSLEYLDLADNYISSWNGNVVFGNNSGALRKIDLTGNKISVINETSFPVSIRSKLKYIDLSENQLSCSCENLWFRNWMKSTNVTFVDGKNYRCMFPPTMKQERKKFVDYNPTIEDCTERNLVLLISVPVSVLFIIIVIFSILVYKFRWHIRYRIYLMRKKGYKSLEIDKDFNYDGFVIYSDEDRQWVHEILLTYLEQNEGFHLCIRLRDFEVGKVFVENIVENMDSSRKIIFILSNNFAKDQWCRFQFLLAHHRIIETGNNNIVLIMKEDIQNENLTGALTALLSSTSYAKWSEEESGLRLFWEQVKTYLSLQ